MGRPLALVRPLAVRGEVEAVLDRHAVGADDFVRLELYTWTTPAQIETGVKSLGKLLEKLLASSAAARGSQRAVTGKALV